MEDKDSDLVVLVFRGTKCIYDGFFSCKLDDEEIKKCITPSDLEKPEQMAKELGVSAIVNTPAYVSKPPALPPPEPDKTALQDETLETLMKPETFSRFKDPLPDDLLDAQTKKT